MILEIVARKIFVLPSILSQLRKRYGEGSDFGISGLMYVLAKPL